MTLMLSFAFLALLLIGPPSVGAALHPTCRNEGYLNVSETRTVLIQVSYVRHFMVPCLAYEIVPQPPASSDCSEAQWGNHQLKIVTYDDSASDSDNDNDRRSNNGGGDGRGGRGGGGNRRAARSWHILEGGRPPLPTTRRAQSSSRKVAVTMGRHEGSRRQNGPSGEDAADDDGPIVSPNLPLLYDHDISSLLGGSVVGASYSMDKNSVFEVIFRYPHAKTCPIQLRLGLTAGYSERDVATHNVPIVVGHDPFVLTTETPATFTFDRMEAAETATWDRVAVSPETIPCNNGVDRSLGSAATRYTNDQRTAFDWTVTPARQGSFRLCVKTGRNRFYHEVAFFDVFGGNPAYFRETFVTYVPGRSGGSRDDGEVRVRLTFYGAGLDPLRDRAIVAQARGFTECSGNSRTSNQVTILRNLACGEHAGKSCDQAVNTTISAAESGQFRVCYYHAATRKWVEVHWYGSLSLGGKKRAAQNITYVGATPSVPPPPPPAPNGRSCGSAPPPATNADGSPDWPQLLQIEVLDSLLRQSFVRSLASFLCVAVDNIFVFDVSGSQTADNKATVVATVEIHCNQTEACDGKERMQYLEWAGRNKLVDMSTLGILSVARTTYDGLTVRNSAQPVTTSTPYVEKDEKSGKRMLIIGIVIAAIVIAILAAVTIFLCCKLNEKRKVRIEDLPEAHAHHPDDFRMRDPAEDRGDDVFAPARLNVVQGVPLAASTAGTAGTAGSRSIPPSTTHRPPDSTGDVDQLDSGKQ